ncbi:DNA polymerase delta subunit 3 isoform X1 [Brachionus plicatilis]|uniref:DNA polymerase delta subunit 3 n=1 Tax=Brachionus plicatilis TaxID=10195 RepID=A0A3M7S772_BRAPC|nr:DNA polymerase delta subunit 3 isoform X1 [Brachionus plicatilis]
MVLDFDNEIEILLNDQEKIVTYKELNNRFDITPSQSQELLCKFVEKKRKEDPTAKFYVTFNKQISLVNEADIDSFEKECKIESKKVYSIQNFKIEDFNLLFSNDVDSSNNIARKSNLLVKFNDKIPVNLAEKATVVVKNEPLVEIKPKPIETAKTTSSDLSKHKEDVSNQKENIKGSVKVESMDTSEPIGKKTKFGEESKQKSTVKPNAKQPVKNQSTLTSFFKKA